MADDELDTRTPFSVNQYQVGRLLGAGAFGDVRLGTDTAGREYAVKCLSRSFLKKKREFVRSGAGRPKMKTALDDVQREIAIMKKTKHPNLVSLVEAIDDEADDALYIVLEFVTGGQAMYFDGKKKRYFTKDGGAYSESRAKELSRDVIKGLRYLHKQGIIHRDLKPENLLLSDEGVCKIADFGIAQKLDLEKRASASITNMQGTHQFMSPEMITEAKYDGFLVDVWAFGVCLYIFVGSKLPFWGDSPEEVFSAITDSALTMPDSASPELRDVLSKILEKDPAKRLRLDAIAQLNYFDFEVVEAVPTVELTEEERVNAFTPRLDFAQTAALKVKMGRWKKQASERSKTFSQSSTSLDSVSAPPTVKEVPSELSSAAASVPVKSSSVEVAIEDSKGAASPADEPVPPKASPEAAEEQEASPAGAAKASAVSSAEPAKVAAVRAERDANGCCLCM